MENLSEMDEKGETRTHKTRTRTHQYFTRGQGQNCTSPEGKDKPRVHCKIKKLNSGEQLTGLFQRTAKIRKKSSTL